MGKYEAIHYVPKPDGGLATPGEILEPEQAARFTDAQIERLLKAGAIREIAPAFVRDAATDNRETEEEAPLLEEPQEDEITEEPAPEIDAMEGIVAPGAEADAEEKPKNTRGRRKKS